MEDSLVNNSAQQNRPGLAYVVHSLNPGGTERLVVDMSLALAEEFRLIVVCLDEKGLWARQLEGYGIPVYCLRRKPGIDINIPWQLARIFREMKIKIIHSHQCTPWFYSALSRVIYSPPMLFMQEHGRFFPEVKNAKRIFINKLIIAPLTYRFVAVSKDIKNRLSMYEGIRFKNIEVVYNGVLEKPSMPRAKIRHDLGLDDNSFLVGTIGRLDKIKNIPFLLKAIKKIVNKVPNIRLVIIGDGQEFNEIKNTIAEMRLNEIVKLIGFKNNAAGFLGGLDLFVLPSLSEGISLALLEAMAGGVPVIATAVGGTPEVIINNRTGWLVPSNDINDLAATILEAIADSDQRQRFAWAAKEHFYQNFAFKKMLNRYRSLYYEVLMDTYKSKSRAKTLLNKFSTAISWTK